MGGVESDGGGLLGIIYGLGGLWVGLIIYWIH
jgi:hypothetical protein